MSATKNTPDAEALFTAIEYAVLRKMNGFDRGELQACKDTLLMHMCERAELLEALIAFRDGGPQGGQNFAQWHQSYAPAIEKALAAIEKATGSAS